MQKRSREVAWLLGIVCVASCARCAQPEAMSNKPEPLSASLAWYGENRQRLQAFIDSAGRSSGAGEPGSAPVAVFDWDNTVVKNDIGDATLFYMLRNSKVRQPREKDWRRTSRFLTGDAVAALSSACSGLAGADEPLPTGQDMGKGCATEIVKIYTGGTTKDGKKAFAGFNYRRMEPAYAWAGQLLAGYSHQEARAIGEAALTEALVAPENTSYQIGEVTGLTGWLRLYPQMMDLIATLHRTGFAVWVVSASPQPIVEAAAARLGIDAEHVIGIRQVARGGRLSADIQGCGDVPDGNLMQAGPLPAELLGNTAITYIEGKRCWINKQIYGVTGATAWQRAADPARRPAFGAGDSDTDVVFLQDATQLKLVLNRNKRELMCNAYANAGGRWLINPMFIKPNAEQKAPYACSTTACKNEGGQSGSCVDENGVSIADQVDSVFPR